MIANGCGLGARFRGLATGTPPARFQTRPRVSSGHDLKAVSVQWLHSLSECQLCELD